MLTIINPVSPTEPQDNLKRFNSTLTIQRVPALDGWRAVAVSLVVLGHLAFHSALAVRLEGRIPPSIGALATLGVDIFFVISGYVICSVLLREYAAYQRISIRAFYYRRAFRILPPLACYLAVAAILGLLHLIQTPPQNALRAAAFLCNIPGGVSNCGWHYGHTWSLAYEEQFYIIAPVALAIFTPRKRRAWAMALVGMMILSIALYALHITFAGFVQTFEYLLCGVVMALYTRELEDLLRRIPTVVVYAGIVALFIVYPLPPSAFHTALVILIVCPLIGLMLLFTSRVPCAMGRFLSSAPMTTIGRASYGIYLWQQLATGDYQGAGPSFYFVSVSAVIILSIGSYRLLEKPLMRVGASLSEQQIKRDSVLRSQPLSATQSEPA